MGLTLYSIGILLYHLMLRIASLFSPKANKWILGRKNWHANLVQNIQPGKWIWMHCASLGEFEQGRPVIEALLEEFPDHQLLLTFFSPSGYEIRKNYSQAAYVAYLPLDTPSNAQAFLDATTPQMALFVKYDLWVHFLKALFARNIPVVLISARMSPKTRFLRGPLARLYLPLFPKFRAIFTQDEATAKLLHRHAPSTHAYPSSDTRFDRVRQTRHQFRPIPQIAQFVGDRKCLVGGSTWPKGEQFLFSLYEHIASHHPFCMILAPHEIHTARIRNWCARYPDISLTFSEIDQLTPQHRILWIDNIGMLSRLYAYADIAYIGGAWDKGLHNTLEAVVFGKPVLFGPNYSRFPEAFELLEHKIGFSVDSPDAGIKVVENILSSPQLQDEIRRTCQEYIDQNAGATQQILNWIKQEKLLHA